MSDQNAETEASFPSHKEPIAPIDFTPTNGEVKPTRFRFHPLQIALGMALLFSLLILWFLLSAKSVVVNVVPESARVNIDGGFTFKLADHYLIRPGNYQVPASADGYITLNMAFQVSSDENQLLPLMLEKKPGHLDITTNPAGAEILVDDQPRGTSPTTITPLKAGKHQLTIRAPRYFPFQSSIDIEGMDRTQQYHADLKPAWGHVQLNTSPSGATVKIGTELRGTTPLTTELLSEGETVAVSLEGFKSWQKTLAVEAGETKVIPEISLTPSDGIVKLSSVPSGATVTVDGEYRGITPLTLGIDANGEHDFSLFLNGYQTRKESISLAPGETKSLNIPLTANRGDIRIMATPSDAAIWIDGTPRGKTPQTFSLPARPHRIEIKKNGYASQTRTVTPQPKLDQLVSVKLLTLKEARWASTPKEITSPGDQQLKLFKPTETFTMGASRRESGRRANEVLRDVTVTRPFYLATKEVTNQQFKQFQPQHSSRHINGNTLDRPTQPVVNVSWEQAARYCNWLSQKEQLSPVYIEQQGKITGTNMHANGYRLPTEAEWAWAARVTKNGEKKHIWGDGFPPKGKSGNFADTSAAKIVGRIIASYHDGFPVSAPVGSFAANEKGLYDLGGNVSEWVHDYYGIEFSLSMKADKDPTGPEKGDNRVIRGASWRHSDITSLRLSFRDYGKEPRDDVGFRIARYVE
jgi:formylglycine-generating enzyme required for sulfatase activity